MQLPGKFHSQFLFTVKGWKVVITNVVFGYDMIFTVSLSIRFLLSTLSMRLRWQSVSIGLILELTVTREANRFEIRDFMSSRIFVCDGVQNSAQHPLDFSS
jgi:hypothetical protein